MGDNLAKGVFFYGLVVLEIDPWGFWIDVPNAIVVESSKSYSVSLVVGDEPLSDRDQKVGFVFFSWLELSGIFDISVFPIGYARVMV